MDNLEFKTVKPSESIADFVESFWMLQNLADTPKEIVILPDGRVDLILAQSATKPFHITLSGLETLPAQALLPPKSLLFAISFKMLATEYILHNTISTLLNNAEILPADFWDFKADDMLHFEQFCKKASQKIQSLLPQKTDQRKLKLFELIYASKGSISVKELSEKVFWNSRQINRYFNQQFGLSLKLYCNILRFRASLQHIAQGKLAPELNYTDQSHFIKEVKKFSGVIPKDLLKNKNDRFIQFSVLAYR